MGVPDTNRRGVLWGVSHAYCIADNCHVKNGHPAPSAAQEQFNCSFSNLMIVRIVFMISSQGRKVPFSIVKYQMQELIFDLQSMQQPWLVFNLGGLPVLAHALLLPGPLPAYLWHSR